MYGTHVVSEPILVDLLRCASVQRLGGVGQHGITGLLGLTPPVTRLEHSVGAMLLVRSVGGSVAEQVCGLLHDISHTVLSHVMDWALSSSHESFHEVHKDRYVATTEIPSILATHGYPLHSSANTDCVLDEERYPLVEMPSPHLCADRLDYGLRDSVAFEKMSREDASKIFQSLSAYPNSDSPSRLLVITDENLALVLARAYLASDRDVWSNPAHVDMYRRLGQVIGDQVRAGTIPEAELWRLSDSQFWDTLRANASPEERKILDHLEQGPPEEKTLSLPREAKVRTIDPDVSLLSSDPKPLSIILPVWANERQAYIDSREARRAQ